MITSIPRTVQSISLIGVFALATFVFYKRAVQIISVDADIAPFTQSAPVETMQPELPTLSASQRADNAKLLERPLFEISRRPPEETKVFAQPIQQVKPKPEVNAQLLGTIIQSTGNIAILKDRNSGDIVRLQVGSKFNGLEVAQITGKSVIFKSGNDSMQLSISVKND